MTQFKIVTADHDESDALEIVASLVLGENIERLLLDATSPISHLLMQARIEFLRSTVSLIDPAITDLSNEEGIKQARSLQATVQRYLELCRWIGKAKKRGEEAYHQARAGNLIDEGEEAVAELMDQIHGKRATPAPDA